MEGEGAHNTQNTKQNTIHNTHFVIIIIAFKSLEIKNLHFDRRERAKTKPKPKPTSCYSGLNIQRRRSAIKSYSTQHSNADCCELAGLNAGCCEQAGLNADCCELAGLNDDCCELAGLNDDCCELAGLNVERERKREQGQLIARCLR